MHSQNTWGNSPARSAPDHHQSSSDLHPPPQDGLVHTLLMRLMDHSDATMASLGRIETRLEHGDDRMDGHERRIARLEEGPSKAGGDQPSRVERLAMRWAAYLIPAFALWATGSWDTALKVLAAIKP